MKKYFFGMLFLLLTFSCTDEKESIIGQIDFPEETQTQLKFSADGGNEEFKFSSTLGWKASANADWIRLSPAFGEAGEANLTIEVSPSNELRKASVIIDNGEVSKEIFIEQSKYPSENNFNVYATELTLEKYENEKFEWHLILKDKSYVDSYGADGKSVFLKLYVDKTHDYSKGIPYGEFVIGDKHDVGSSLGVLLDNNKEYLLNAGSVELIKKDDGLQIGLLSSVNDGPQIVTYYDVDPEYFHLFNYAYGSTISRDLNIDNYDQAYIMDEGDVFREGMRIWRLNIGQKDIQFKYIGLHEGAGEWLTITIITSLDKKSPVGSYEFVMDDRTLVENTALGGYRSEMMGGIGFNSWWRRQTGPNEFVEESPFVAGKIDISQNNDGSYSINVLAVDDALPENNTLIVNYQGTMDVYDPTQTGDYASSNIDFYGPFLFDSPNMNWFIGLGDEDYTNSYGGNGNCWVFDLMSNPDQKFTNGTPYGVYRIVENTNYEAGTIHMAYHRIYENWEFKEEIKLVSGQIELKSLPDGREKIIVNAIDEKGKTHKGTYIGTIPRNSLSIPPYQNRVFDGNNAQVTANYFGENLAPENETPEKTGWDLILEDKSFYESRGENGLAIELEIRTTSTKSFEDGLPIGVFPLYEPYENGIEEGIYNGDYTLYTVAYETAQSRVMITGGHVEISKENGIYTIELSLETANDVVRFTVTGVYEGSVKLNDYSSPFAASKMSRTSKSEPMSKVSEKAKLQFKK